MSFEVRIDTSKWEELTKALTESVERINSIADSIVIPDFKVLPKIEISNVIQERFRAFNDTMDQLAKSWASNYSQALVNLDSHAEEGWFVEFSDINLRDYFGLINTHEPIDEVMSRYYNDNLDRIEQTLLERHPIRAQTIKQVFKAHKKKWYQLTCPAIFSLVDGVCRDGLDIRFFAKNRSKDHTLLVNERMTQLNAEDLFVKPIANNKPAYSHQRDLKNFPCKLNRHAIMHGEDSEYGTKVNSLKCISLLIYVSDLIMYYKMRNGRL